MTMAETINPTDTTTGTGTGSSSATRPRARSGLTGLPTERVEAEIVDLTARMAAGTYELLVLVGELDSRGSWATWGALSCAAWLADRCDIEVSTARTQVRVAKAMIEHPTLDAAMACGDVSYAKARVLVGHLTPDNAAALLDLAERHPAGRLGAAIAAWSQRNEDPDTIAARQHEARSLTWRTDPDGTVVLTARLTPETAGIVCAVIDTTVTRADAPAGASLAQQRADALTAVVAGGGGGVPQVEVVLHVTEDGNHFHDGTPLSDHAVTHMLPDAFISLLILDKQRWPIDASPRRRFPTRRQRRVVDERHHDCQETGCHATGFLQIDHKVPYSQGGPTTLDNLQRLCGPHNRARASVKGDQRRSTRSAECAG